MQNPYLISDNIYARPLEREDAPTVLQWFNDPEVNHFLLARHPINLQAEERFIDHISQSETDLALLIARRDGDQPIGVMGFHPINLRNRNAVFGITIGAKHHWGQGYGTEATKLLMNYGFDSLNLHRVTLQVFEYNERAIRIYENLGFRREGVMREENYRSGRYWDTIVMGLLREDWEARRQNDSS